MYFWLALPRVPLTVSSQSPAHVGRLALGELQTAAVLSLPVAPRLGPSCRCSLTRVPSLPLRVLNPVFSASKAAEAVASSWPSHPSVPWRGVVGRVSCAAAFPVVYNLCFLLCLDLGPGALKVPNEADEGGRATSGSARKGKRQHTSPQNPLLDCSLCGKVFSSASSLSKHYLTHSQERKHVCKVCSKAFKRQDHLYVGVWSGNVCWGVLVGIGHVAVSLPPPPRSTCSPRCWVSLLHVPQVGVTSASFSHCQHFALDGSLF